MIPQFFLSVLLAHRTTAKPNYALQDHWNDGIAASIAADRWQVVVMQQ